MESKNLIVAGAVLILATGVCLFLNSDFDGDNLAGWEGVLIGDANPFSRNVPEGYYQGNTKPPR